MLSGIIIQQISHNIKDTVFTLKEVLIQTSEISKGVLSKISPYSPCGKID